MRLSSQDPDPDGAFGQAIGSETAANPGLARRVVTVHEGGVERHGEDWLVEEVPVERRDYSSVCLAMKEGDLDRFRDRIIKFQEEMGAEAEVSAGSDVYVLACQLFPVTRGVSS